MLHPNSKAWWDDAFTNWWIKTKGINGPDQTRYFMGLIVKHCGIDISGSVLDYGCAMGQGVEVLGGQAEGYDFSLPAITAARKMVPGHKFTNTLPNKKYNFVICSNVLEHYQDPMPEFNRVLSLAKKYAIFMTPYNQKPTCEVHPVTITEHTFPKNIDGFSLVKFQIVPNESPNLGIGDQILFVYQGGAK